MPMQPKAEQVIENVITRRHSLKQLLNSSRIAGLHSGIPFSVITITVAKPTAAEHTMQPASIRENSC
mgnify:CR=1 FL=1